jgi:hypothetical protein
LQHFLVSNTAIHSSTHQFSKHVKESLQIGVDSQHSKL